MVGLSNTRLVGLFALVPPDTASVDLLGPVSIAGFVEKDAAACGNRDFGGQRSGRRQHDTESAHQRLYDGVFSVNGMSDGFVANVLSGVVALAMLSRGDAVE